jgi:hypothetical protein
MDDAGTGSPDAFVKDSPVVIAELEAGTADEQ